MRNIIIAFGTLTLLVTSPAFAGGASYVIGDDLDHPTTPAMSAGVSGNAGAASVRTPGGKSHVIRDDQDQSVTLATDTRVSGGRQASHTVTLAYAPGQARVVKPGFAQGKSHVIGRDN